MNMLLPPLMASVLLAGYVATVSNDRTDGDERRYAADNMVRYHSLAVDQARAGLPVVNLNMAPFAKVLDWRSQVAFDNTDTPWVVTYIASAAVPQPSTIGDIAVSSIPYELARTQFSSGTFGIWKNNVLASTLGDIPFTEVPAGRPAPPVVPNGTPVIATRF
jgi:hypothetical protein